MLASTANLRFVFSLILVVLLWLLNYFKIYPEITELVSAALLQNSMQIKPVGSDVEVLPSQVVHVPSHMKACRGHFVPSFLKPCPVSWPLIRKAFLNF